jgi:hypothetical protein
VQIQDALAEFSEEVRTQRDTYEAPFTGELKAKVPGLAETLPERVKPTRGGAVQKGTPLFTQLSGIKFVPEKNDAEAELSRHRFKPREIYARTGNPIWDRAMTEAMGPLVEERIGRLVASGSYLSKTDAQQAEILGEKLNDVERLARFRAKKAEPEAFKAVQRQRMPARHRAVLEEAGK